MFDIIIRYCGWGEFLPVIVNTETGAELYRGARHSSADAAFAKALEVWETNGTGNIAEFKQAQGL